ncbi:MAG: hypothetical protein WD038_12230 [Balneolales bacterium]
MLFVLIILITAFASLNLVQDEDTTVGQVSRPFAEVTDPELIDLFLYEFLIPESDVTTLEIIDVTANGFGPDDIIVTHPSMQAYIVEEPSNAALEIMRNWSLEDYRIDSDNIDPDVFDPEITGQIDNAAENAILADLLRTLNRNYASLPIRMRLERDENGFTFEMWDYEEGSLNYTPSPTLVPDSVLVHHTESDTVVTDRMLVDYLIDSDEGPSQYTPGRLSVPDSIFVHHTESDTVFLDRRLVDYLIGPDEGPSGYTPSYLPVPDSVFAYQTENDTIILDEQLVDYLVGPGGINLGQYAPEPVSDDIEEPAIEVGDVTEGAKQEELNFPPIPDENNLYDVIYISKTVTDTVYIPEKRPSSTTRPDER